MSDRTDFSAFQQMLEQATPEEVNSLFFRLVARIVSTPGTKMQAVKGERGMPVGIFIPVPELPASPPMSETGYEQLKEAVRTTTTNQLLTNEQLKQRLGLVDVRPPNRQ